MAKLSLYQNRLLAEVFALTLFVTGCSAGSKIEPLYVLEGHNSSVADLAFSPDGRTLASVSAGDGTMLSHIGRDCRAGG